MSDLSELLANVARVALANYNENPNVPLRLQVALAALEDVLVDYDAAKAVRECEQRVLRDVAGWYRGADSDEVNDLGNSYLALLAARNAQGAKKEELK